jgi:4'-phosphopantetheinyl transferase
LEPDEIHIHILRSEREEFRYPPGNLLDLLPHEENTFSKSIEREQRRKEFIWSRVLLRGVLASYLERDPRELQFNYSAKGKPFLEDTKIEFNISHTEGLIACSVGWRRLGIDVERFQDGDGRPPDWNLLTRRYFSEAETKFLFSQEPALQKHIFLKIFTLKEAQAKAEGEGLSLLFSRFSVPLVFAERSRQGPWEYVSKFLESYNVFLANVAENPEESQLRYRFWEWNEESFQPPSGKSAEERKLPS